MTPSELIYPPASDIAVQNGKILCIGSLAGIVTAKKTIDAEGGYVTPGGVDTHVHLDQISLIGAIGDKIRDWNEKCYSRWNNNDYLFRSSTKDR